MKDSAPVLEESPADAEQRKSPSRLKISSIKESQRFFRLIAVLAIAIIATTILKTFVFAADDEDTSRRTYSEFNADLAAGKVAKLTVNPSFPGEKLEVTLKDETTYKVAVPRIDMTTADRMFEAGVEVSFKEPPTDVSRYLSLALFGLLFLYLGFMVVQSSPVSLKFFGGKRRTEIKFSDVAGAEEAKAALQEIVAYLKDPAKFEQLGAEFPKGVVLYGDPGTGKTLLAKAVAGEAGAGFIATSGSDFSSMFVGVAGMKIRKVFSQARRVAPCVLFIDEIDSIGGKRLSESSATAREMGSTLNQLLVQMDGFESNSGVIVIAATNRIGALDPALLRSGRFDRRIHMPAPNLSEREQILKIHGGKLTLAVDFNYPAVARATYGMSGADLANLMNQAAMIAVREGASDVSTEYALRARDVILMGEERKSTARALDVKTRQLLAVHEAGHAVTALACGPDPVTRVSIIPRGPALGVTFMSPQQDRFMHDEAFLRSQLLVLLGGRCAEKLVLNCSTTGASDDLAKATRIAQDMVNTYGMSRLGLLRVGNESSPQLRFEAELEAKKIIDESMAMAEQVLSKNRDLLDRMSDALIEREELDEHAIAALVKSSEPLSTSTNMHLAPSECNIT